MKNLLKSCTILSMAVSLAGQATANEMLMELGEGEGALNIVAWAGYIERGETNPNLTG